MTMYLSGCKMLIVLEPRAVSVVVRSVPPVKVHSAIILKMSQYNAVSLNSCDKFSTVLTSSFYSKLPKADRRDLLSTVYFLSL